MRGGDTLAGCKVGKRAFAVAAHPDDIEFAMAGTLILLAQAGYEIHYMNIANGSCGSAVQDPKTIVRIRREEAISAAKSIGAVFHESLANDMEVFYEKDLLARLGSVMREVAPDILLVPSPADYMEDHQNASRLAVTAAFCRGMRNFPVNPPRAQAENDVTIYHAQPHGNCDALRNPIMPEIFVDISGVMERKTAMLAEHKSQKEWLDRSQGMDSYLIAMKEIARAVGKLSGRYVLAEGWRRHSHLGLCAEDAEPLAEALGSSCLVRQGR